MGACDGGFWCGFSIDFVCLFPCLYPFFFSFDGFVVDEERDVVLRKRLTVILLYQYCMCISTRHRKPRHSRSLISTTTTYTRSLRPGEMGADLCRPKITSWKWLGQMEIMCSFLLLNPAGTTGCFIDRGFKRPSRQGNWWTWWHILC